MGKIGFDVNNEFLPSFDKFQTMVNRRLMFLKLYNQEVPCDMKFSKNEINESKKETLFNIFAKKILKNLKHPTYIQSHITKIDVELTNKINTFLKKVNKKSGSLYRFSLLNSFEERNISTAAKLICILEECNYSFYLDGEKIFKNFVLNKILRSSENREVSVNLDSIDIKSEEYLFKTKIFTFWEFINSENLKIDKHIQKAVNCIKTSEFNQVYLVYPKNENFNRHIQIKCEDLANSEYMIKLIPYSMRSTLR
ncbi:hypothetical protein [Halarcobacter anaerophilus]|uniref:Uncharacterized protein n=1 Tax=Halarcobacter anaerophilus TaxID=877500 RepID=A0A4V1LPR0_9BACT|nr:hypothetical protein [Halarcobacter anaerophilus]QDF28264.1 hypothetical protein AANAER_0770 [Halarcobacter anaerophilus]RXJ62068.1 hypothetical protein CRV06_11595 [Halarcobacter anaerophilus]